MRVGIRLLLSALLVGALANRSMAGPVVIDGTDANDHGSFNGVNNVAGWIYMQKVLENLAGSVDSSVSKNLVVLGTAPGSQARDAIQSAFDQSSLFGAWSISYKTGGTDVGNWLGSMSTSDTGILYIPTRLNTVGDLTQGELDAINAHASDIANYVSGAGDPTKGGGLFSMGETNDGFGLGVGTDAYKWLTTLIPGITFTDVGGGGINTDLSLTADGMSDFPGLTNADLSAGPWHGYFGGSLGTLNVLATAPDNSGYPRDVIIGGGAGTVIAAPEPALGLLLLLGLAGVTLRRRRKLRIEAA